MGNNEIHTNIVRKGIFQDMKFKLRHAQNLGENSSSTRRSKSKISIAEMAVGF